MKYPCRTRNLLFADYCSAVIKDEAIEELGLESDIETKLIKGIFNLANFECAFDVGGGFTNIQLLGELYTINVSFVELTRILKEFSADTDIFFNDNKN